jgi:TolB-like protein
MRRAILLLCIILTAITLPASAQQDRRPGIAVLPFENGGSYGRDKEDFTALEQGIPALLITSLQQNQAARVVDRSDIHKLLGEQNLAAEGRVDAATAARIGKLVGARYMIMGTFVDYYGKFRIDARIVDVETGEILKVVSVGPQDREKLYDMLQQTADKIMAGTNLPPLPEEVAQAARARKIPAEALTLYSRGLLYQDRGDRDKAIEYYRKALAVYPDFTEPDEALKKIQNS